ncbi:MAG TPA: NAD(P)-dependent oxidoreductase [Dehalococcoidia bacterium]|nr:NAD(P)-dependent oxidoreductase [Dehalococcoidia bacterium]
MSILVTGSSGGIGGNVVRMLLEAGEEVVGFDVAPAGPGSVAADVADHFPLVLGSVTDLACLMRATQHHGVEGIIHMAAMLFLGLEWRTHEMVRVNIEGTVNVLEATRLLGLPKMVFTSSYSAAGLHPDLSRPVPEDGGSHFPLHTIYATTKLAAEGICHRYREDLGMDVRIVRPASVYGPGLYRPDFGRPVDSILNELLEGRDVQVAHGSDTLLDYTYVMDEARGIIQAYEAESTQSWIFNISFGQHRTLGQIVEVMRREFPDRTIDVGLGSWNGLDGKGTASLLRPPSDSSLAREELGYDPQYDIDRAIPAYVRWLRNREYV